MEQFAGLFIIVAFVLWLVVFVPNRVRTKSDTQNASYEDKFSTGVRVLHNIKNQIKNAKIEDTTDDMDSSTVFKAQMKQNTVSSSPAKRRSKTKKTNQKLKINTKKLFGKICTLLLVTSIATWIFSIFLGTTAKIVASIATVFYLFALLYHRVNTMRTQQKNRKTVSNSAISNTSRVGQNLQDAENKLLQLKRKNVHANASFERAKVIVTDFSPKSYSTKHSINNTLQSQMDYASKMVDRFDDELDSIDVQTRQYRANAR
jgi:membrane protein implicated in regulation of membrane protease activity